VWKKSDQEKAERRIAVFTGRASADECLQTFGEILYEMKLWSRLDGPEDLVLHNHAVDLLNSMGLKYVVNTKKRNNMRFEIDFPQAEVLDEQTRDQRRT
jgi:hypothetical protein